MLFNQHHLQASQDSNRNGRTSERYPAVFTPASSTEVNVSRLPEPEALASMELAFREEPISEEGLYRRVRPWILLFVFVGPAAILFSLFVGRVFLVGPALFSATVLGIISAAILFVVPRKRDYRFIVFSFLAPLIFVLVMTGLTTLIVNRVWTVLTLAAALLFLVFFAGKDLRPFEFYKEWIFTHPRLTPDTRRSRSLQPALSASRFIFVALLLGLTMLASNSPRTATAILFIVGLLLSHDFFSRWKSARKVLAHYLTYSGRETGAAGVWVPKSSVRMRRLYLASTVLLFYAVIAIGTCFYSLGGPNIENRTREIQEAKKISVDDARALAANEASPDPNKLKDRFPLAYYLWGTWNLNTDPYGRLDEKAAEAAPPPAESPSKKEVTLDNLIKLLAKLAEETLIFVTYPLFVVMPTSKALFLLLVYLFATITANTWLLALFEKPLVEADELRRKVEGYEDSGANYWWQRLSAIARNLKRKARGLSPVDPPPPELIRGIDCEPTRTEWQWYVDRIRMSAHNAKDPFGTTVREAEHLFLGVEPSLQIPILLDRKIVSEHCYIVGQTGSGKTTLGIMPILIQLIRGFNRASPDRYKKILSRLLYAFIAQAKRVENNMGGSGSPAEAMNDMLTYIFEQSFVQEDRGDLFEEESIRHLQDELTATVESSVSRHQKAKTALQDLITYAEDKQLSISRDLPEVPFIKSVDQSRFLSQPVPMVIIDLKGDPALFNTIKAEAEARGQQFFFFTPEKGKVSHRFNPFVGFKSEARTFIQLCQLFLDSLSLNHGEGYGRSYYSRRNRQALFLALTHSSKPQTFSELLDVMNEIFKSTEHRDAYEALTTVQALSQYEALVTTSEQEENAPESTINMSRVIEENQVVYFWLPSAIESISAKEIGKLALFALLTAAIDRQLTHPELETKQVYLVVDEFQRLAGENFKIILEQARSFGLSAILANQTLSDLRTKDSDLRSTVLTNTRMRLFFTINDPMEMKMLSTLSGEEIRLLKSWTSTDDFRQYMRRDTESETVLEGFKARLTVNDIASISDHPVEMIAHITRGSGYTQFGGLPIRVRTAWPIPRDVYEKRARTQWPTKEEFGANEVIENLRSPREIDEEALRQVSERHQATLKTVLGEIDANI